MEAPLHQSPVPLPPPPPQDDAADVGAPALLLHHQAAAARAMAMAMAAAAHQKPPAPAAMGREQCPRCASRDTKFCYYNNYNTAQPRHFCRRYWTLGGSLRNVPVGGSTRKRPRPARPYTSRAIAAATTTSSPFLASSSAAAAPSLQAGGLLGSLLLLGAASPLLALGAAPLLEGRPGPDLGLEQPAAPLLAGAADLEPPQLGFSAGPPPQPLWPPATTVLLEEWKSGGALRFPLPPGAALWQDLSAAAAAAPPVEAGGLMRHGASPHLLL